MMLAAQTPQVEFTVVGGVVPVIDVAGRVSAPASPGDRPLAQPGVTDHDALTNAFPIAGQTFAPIRG